MVDDDTPRGLNEARTEFVGGDQEIAQLRLEKQQLELQLQTLRRENAQLGERVVQLSKIVTDQALKRN